MASSHYDWEYLDLPRDFISFIRSNYDQIFLIRQKIKEFYERSEEDELFRKTGKSPHVLTTDVEDFSPIIKVRVRRKSNIFQRGDTIEIEPDYVKHADYGSLQKDVDYLKDISRKFPCLVLSSTFPQSHNSDSNALPMAIEGVKIKLAERIKMKANFRKCHTLPKSSPCYPQDQTSFKKTIRQKKCLNFLKTKRTLDRKLWNLLPSIEEIAWDIFNRMKTNANMTPPQLTLPPLHSSVLALIGQRSPGKPSQGVTTPQKVSLTSRQKRLRRHGRRKSESQEKVGIGDQFFENADDQACPPALPDQNSKKVASRELTVGDGPESERIEDANLEKAMTPLYNILDKIFCKSKWYLTEKEIEKEIRDLEEVLGKGERKKKEVDFSSELIRMSSQPSNSKKRLASLCELSEAMKPNIPN